MFTPFLCPPVTARRLGCLQGPGITKRLSACGTSAVSCWESSGSRAGGIGTAVWGSVHAIRKGDRGEGPPCRIVLAGCCCESCPALILLTLLEIFAHPTLSWGWLMARDSHTYRVFFSKICRVGHPLGPEGLGRCQAGHRDGRRTWEIGSISLPRPASTLSWGDRSINVTSFQGL